MRWLVLMLALTACTREELGNGLPFTCPNNSSCPSGYTCEQNLCVPNGGAMAPLLVSVGSLDDAPPRPLWDGTSFYAVWQDSTSAMPGIYFAKVSGTALDPPLLILPESAPAKLDAVFDPTTKTFVIAASSNSIVAGTLDVVYVKEGDTLAVTQPSMQPPPGQVQNPFPGYSSPSLSLQANSRVTLAYTLTRPPDLVTDNVHCIRYSLLGAQPDADCGPEMNDQANGAASSVVAGGIGRSAVARGDFLFFVWRRENPDPMSKMASEDEAYGLYHSIDDFAGIKGDLAARGPFPMSYILSPAKMIVINPALPSFAITWQAAATSSQVKWAVGLWKTFNMDQGATVNLASSDVEPDIAGYANQDMGDALMVVCAGDESGGAVVRTFTAPPLPSDGGFSEVNSAGEPLPRYSTAPVDTCKVAVAREKGQVGILWRERIPPSGAQTYFATLPIAATIP